MAVPAQTMKMLFAAAAACLILQLASAQTVLQSLSVGPIVGATGETTARIWGRANIETGNAPPQPYCYLVVRITGPSATQVRAANIKMVYDFTGVAILRNLASNTGYNYQAGWFCNSVALDTAALQTRSYVWTNAYSSSLRTASANPATSRSFVFGSCRYLLKLFGSYALFDDRGDTTFNSVLNQIAGGRRVDKVLFLGDQIYADDLNIVLPDQQLSEFLERYQAAFSADNIRALMSQVSTNMILDDHEIEDNWPASASGADRTTLFPNAMHAYQSYQAVHSPLYLDDGNSIIGRPNRYWYTFRDGIMRYFVVDTRTERVVTEPGRRIISSEQMNALKAWLTNPNLTNKVKAVVTSVPFFPDSSDGSDDKWSGFLAQRTELLEYIRINRVRKVMFLAGDIHGFISGELTTPSDPAFKVLSIISSPFYWPYTHPQSSDYILQGTLPTTVGTTYNVNCGSVIGDDGFTRVTATDIAGTPSTRVTVEVFGRKGEPRQTRSYTF